MGVARLQDRLDDIHQQNHAEIIRSVVARELKFQSIEAVVAEIGAVVKEIRHTIFGSWVIMIGLIVIAFLTVAYIYALAQWYWLRFQTFLAAQMIPMDDDSPRERSTSAAQP